MKSVTFASIIITCALLLGGCKMSTTQLTEEVRGHMVETWRGQGLNIKINSLMLVHEQENKYSGILETNEDGEEFTYDVEVIYDGETFTWELME